MLNWIKKLLGVKSEKAREKYMPCYQKIDINKNEIEFWTKDRVGIKVLISGKKVDSILEYNSGKYTWMEINIQNVGKYETIGFDVFDALQRIRLQTDPKGIKILCNGLRKNCYPSGMMRDMALGRSCYELEWGRQCTEENVIETLGHCEPEGICEVGEQNTFYEDFLSHFRNKLN